MTYGFYHIVILLFFSVVFQNSQVLSQEQTQIFGKVTDFKSLELAYISVLLLQKTDYPIASFTETNSNGCF